MEQHFTSYSKRAANAILAIMLLAGFCITPNAGAQTRPDLGSASTYAIFTGGGAINNTGYSVLTGDVGQDGAYAFNGFPPGTYTGTLNRNNGASAQAKSDLITAQTADGLVACDYVLGVGIVNGQSFDPGVYCSGAATTTTGNITFNAHGNANAIFIVKIGGALSANSGTHILLANNARAANIYWFVDGAVAVADNSSFKGTIIANGAIHFYGTSSLDGRALAAPAGAITLATDTMSVSTDTGAVPNLTVTRPASGDSIRSGTLNDTIRWTGSGIALGKTIQYSLDSGVTWDTIASISNDSFVYLWNVPDTTSTEAFVRVTDSNNLRGVSGVFKIIGKIIVVNPAAGALITGGTLHDTITWTGSGLTPIKTFAYSLDSGLTWTTIGKDTTNGFTYLWNVPDTGSAKAVIRITDSNGVTGKSGVFTFRSITVVAPAAGALITGGTLHDTIRWTGTGLNAKKTFALSLDSGLTWTTIGRDTTNGFTYSWNVPDTVSTKAMIRITDSSGVTGKSGLFTIKSSKIIVVRPAAGDSILEGLKNYQITWTGTGLTPIKTFAYSLDGGVTWTTIGKDTTNGFSFSWNVPDTVSTQAIIRVTDSSGITGMSGLFTIRTNQITVTSPTAGEKIAEGTQNFLVSWTGTGITAQKTLDLSLDGGRTWTTIGTITANVFAYYWNVPDTTSTLAIIRITDTNGMTGQSGIFTIKSNSALVVVHPWAGEVIAEGLQNYQITWTGIGLAAQKTFDLSLDGGQTWTTIASINIDSFTYLWNVPNTPSTQAIIRITDANGITGESGLFTIKANAGTISIYDPMVGEKVDGGTVNYVINWNATNVTAQKTLEYSLDGGLHWTVIGIMNSESQSYLWALVPNVATTDALVRIIDANGVTGISGLFTITTRPNIGSMNSLTLGGLDYKSNIANNQPLEITWAFTPDIGTSVNVEYSLDYTATWQPIATVPVTESPNSTAWMTTPSGYYNPVFIRVTSSLGMTLTSIPFSIGTAPSSVGSNAVGNGYSISNYPNPANEQTTINFILPVRSDVTLVVCDNLGRTVSEASGTFGAGTNTIPVNTSKLTNGSYSYTLIAGNTRLSGRMNVVR